MGETYKKEISFLSEPDTPTQNEHDSTGVTAPITADVVNHQYWKESVLRYYCEIYEDANNGFEQSIWELDETYTESDNIFFVADFLVDTANNAQSVRLNIGLFNKDDSEPWDNALSIYIFHNGGSDLTIGVGWTNTTPTFNQTNLETGITLPTSGVSVDKRMFRIYFNYIVADNKLYYYIYDITGNDPPTLNLNSSLTLIASGEYEFTNPQWELDTIGITSGYAANNATNTDYVIVELLRLAVGKNNTSLNRMIRNLPPFLETG